MVSLVVHVLAGVGLFVFGVLFERRNTKKVEAIVSKIDALAAKVGVKL